MVLPALEIYIAKPIALFFKEIPSLNFEFIKLLLENYSFQHFYVKEP